MKITTDDYLNSIGLGVTKGEADTQWPLMPSQIMPYFELDQAVEIYDLLKKAREKLSDKEIAELFKFPGIIANFLRNSAITGLKVANILKIKRFATQEKEDYLIFLIKLMGVLCKNDPLRRDGKNLILDSREVKELVKTLRFINVSNKQRALANGFYATLFSWLWSTHYDTFIGAALEPHGPYEIIYNGQRNLLLVREFHDFYTPVWKTAQKLPFKTARVYQVYKDINVIITFENQVTSKEALGQHLVAFALEVDGKQITDIKTIEKYESLLESLVSEQTKEVRSLKKVDQAKRGGLVSYYSLRRIYEYFQIDWDRSSVIDKNIKLFGDKWIKILANKKAYSKDYFKILDDPRNDLLGEDALKMLR